MHKYMLQTFIFMAIEIIHMQLLSIIITLDILNALKAKEVNQM